MAVLKSKHGLQGLASSKSIKRINFGRREERKCLKRMRSVRELLKMDPWRILSRYLKTAFRISQCDGLFGSISEWHGAVVPTAGWRMLSCKRTCSRPGGYCKSSTKWKRKSLSRVRLFATPWTTQSLEFSRPEYWSGWPFLLQGVFPTQGWNPGLPHCRWILHQLSHRRSPPKHFPLSWSEKEGWVTLSHSEH